MMSWSRKIRIATIAAAAFALAPVMRSQSLYQEPKALPQMGKPKGLLGVGIEQKLDQPVPMDVTFHDETGKTVRLGDYFGSKPVLLTLVYYTCPQLCDEVETGIASMLKVVKFDPGRDFNVVSVSINPNETPADALKAKQKFVKFYDRAGTSDGLHFLTGDKANIDELAQAVGYHYNYDPASKQYFHATAIMIATPAGKLAQYFYGIEYAPVDVRLALAQASKERIGNLTDTVLLYCFHYDPATGHYSATIMNIVRLGGVLAVLCVGMIMFFGFRGERERERAWKAAAGNGERKAS